MVFAALFSPEIVWLVVVGMLWGCTNPLIKHGSSGVASELSNSAKEDGSSSSNGNSSAEKNGKKGVVGTALKDVLFLLSRWRYVVPFLVNQLGSVVFFWRLSGSDMSLVSPVANGLAFFFTALTDMAFFHARVTAKAVLGSILVVLGVALCTLAKV